MNSQKVFSYSSTDSVRKIDYALSSITLKKMSRRLTDRYNLKRFSSSNTNFTLSPYLNEENQFESTIESRLEIPFGDYLEKITERRFKNMVRTQKLSEEEKKQRSEVIDWIFVIGRCLSLMNITVHKAIKFIDRIMETNILQETELKDIGLICLILSSKYLESQPIIEKLIKVFQKRIGNPKDIYNYEVQIMTLLNWDLHSVTAIEFLEVFKSQGVLFSTDNIVSLINDKPLSESLNNILEYISSNCIKNYDLITVDPLLIAAGILALSRKLLGLKDMWNQQLEQLTNISTHQAEFSADQISILCSIEYEDELDEGIRVIKLPRSNCIYTMDKVNTKHRVKN